MFSVDCWRLNETFMKTKETFSSWKSKIPADTDVFKTSSGRLKQVASSYDQIRRRHAVWKKSSDLRHLEDVWFKMSSGRLVYEVLKTSELRCLEDIQFTTSWKRLIYDVFRTSNWRRLDDTQFTLSWWRPIYDVLKMSGLWRLADVCKTTSV